MQSIDISNTLCVDPGMNTGWAYFADKAFPHSSGVFRFKKCGYIVGRETQLKEMYCKWNALLRSLPGLKSVIIEDVIYEGSVRSNISAATGSLMKLAAICYGYGAIAYQSGFDIQYIPAYKWKGQMDDKAVAWRVARVLDKKFRKHELDAVGIGLAMQGLL